MSDTPEPQDMVSKFNEMRECLGVLTAMVRQDFGNVDPRYIFILIRCEKALKQTREQSE